MPIEHRGVVNTVRGLTSIFGVGAHSQVPQLASWSVDAAACEVFLALGDEATVCIAPDHTRHGGEKLASYLRDEPINFATLTLPVLAALSPDNLPDLTDHASVGERCPEDLVAQWAIGRHFVMPALRRSGDAARVSTGQKGPAMSEQVEWTPPGADQIVETSRRFGLGLSPEAVALNHRLGPLFASAHQDLAAWWRASRPAPPLVRWERGEDPWDATEVKLRLARTDVGPLAGTTIAVKSTIAIAGVPLGAGSRLVEGHVPAESATVVERVLDAAGVITHTGRTDNLCLAITGDQSAYGPVLNPWSRGHTTWGSSSGVAALVAAGLTQAGIMVDQAGSGRVPGAGCGLVVLMPTRGLIPMTGILGFTGVQDRVAVGARDTATVARLASVLTGADCRDLKQGPAAPSMDWLSGLCGDVRGLRVGLVTESLTEERCDPEVAHAVRAQVEQLAALGAEVVEVSIPRYADAASLAMAVTVHGGVPDMFATNLASAPSVLAGDPELALRFAARRAEHPEWMAQTAHTSIVAAGHHGGQPAGYWLAVAMALVSPLRAAFDAALNGDLRVDVLVTPTAHATPPTLPSAKMSAEDQLLRALGAGIWHTCALNLTGHPAAQVPAGLVRGLPVGAQIIARHLDDQLCLNVAAALQPGDAFPPPPGEAPISRTSAEDLPTPRTSPEYVPAPQSPV